MRQAAGLLFGTALMMGMFGCSGTKPAGIGVVEDRLSPCPSRPNCVSSDAEDADHRIEPLRFAGDQAAAWSALQEAISALPRTTVVTVDDRYLHAEASSKIFGFVDDVEFHLRPDEDLIAVRSAARTGYSDMGVNAARVEEIREAVEGQGTSSLKRLQIKRNRPWHRDH